MQPKPEPYPFFKELVLHEGWKSFIAALKERKEADWKKLVSGLGSAEEVRNRAQEREEIMNLVDNYIKDFEFEQGRKNGKENGIYSNSSFGTV